MGQWEWIILLLGFLGLLVWELRSVRRAIRRAGDRPGANPAMPGRPQDDRPA